MLASFFSVHHLFALQHILDKGCLIRGKSLTAPKRKEKSIAVSDKEWRKSFGCLRNGKFAGVRGISTARSMIEKYRWKWTRPRWLPEK
jgi:hypothetical protein